METRLLRFVFLGMQHEHELLVDVPSWFPDEREVLDICKLRWPGLWPGDEVSIANVGGLEQRVSTAIQRIIALVEEQRRPQPVAVWGLWSHEQALTLLRERHHWQSPWRRRLSHEQEVRLVGAPPLTQEQQSERQKWLRAVGSFGDV